MNCTYRCPKAPEICTRKRWFVTVGVLISICAQTANATDKETSEQAKLEFTKGESDLRNNSISEAVDHYCKAALLDEKNSTYRKKCSETTALLPTTASEVDYTKPHYFDPVASEGQMLRGAPAANTGAIGIDARKADGGFKVTNLIPSGPAEASGLKVGDVISSFDGKPLASVEQGDFYRLLSRNPGDTLQVSYTRNGQSSQASVTASSRGKLYPQESRLPPGVSQYLFDGRSTVTAAMSQDASKPQSVNVMVFFSNIDLPPLSVEDSKFFVLDGSGQQLRHMSLEEVKYPMQLWVSQNLRSGNYPPPTPPPPQHNYVITGVQNGNYTFTQMGNMATISGNSTSTYNVQEQTNTANQTGYMLGYTLGTALRQRADRKHNEQVIQLAQQALSQWDASYFKSQTPIIPGENRGGGILYWTGSSRSADGPFKLVLFLTDPSNGKQETVKFEFH